MLRIWPKVYAIYTLYFTKLVQMEQRNETTTQLLVYLQSSTHALPRANAICQPYYYTRYLWSTILILDHHRFLSCAMSSVNLIHFISLLMTLLQVFFGRPLPLLQCKRLITSHILTGAFTLLFLTCLNHLNLVSLSFYSRGATLTCSLITRFLIISSLVKPYIHWIILISAPSTFGPGSS